MAELPWPDTVQEVSYRYSLLAHMRGLGVKLRETDSMGLADYVRISVQPSKSQQA